MRYFLIDRVLRVERDKKITATKNVALSEDVFTDHFLGRPLMPGALLIEAQAQAGTVLLEASTQFKKKALLIMIDKAKFRVEVQPGDQLLITMNILELGTETSKMEGTIHIDKRLVMDAQLTFTLKEIDDYYLPKIKLMMNSVYDFWLKNTEWIGFDEIPGHD